MIRITHDVFDIAWRIKSIDSEYELFYNREAHRFEVQARGVLQAIIPYDTLDNRTLIYLRETRRENLDKLIAKIEGDNERIEKEKDDLVRKRAEYNLEEVMRCS